MEDLDSNDGASAPTALHLDTQFGLAGLLTVRDVARMLRVPISWVYDHTRPGCRDPLPYLKLGKYVRFQAAAVQSYLEEIQLRNGR